MSGLKIALMGVHGIGKTSLCRYMRKEGYYCVEVEDNEFLEKALSIEEKEKRQEMFMQRYIDVYRKLRRMQMEKPVIIDSHPLAVVAYTYYFGLKKLGNKFLLRISDTGLRDVLKVNEIILLEPVKINDVVRRVWLRGRSQWSSEAFRDYIEGVAGLMDDLFEAYSRIFADRVMRIKSVDGVRFVANEFMRHHPVGLQWSR